MTTLWKKRLMNILALLVTGAVILPVGAYLVGGYIVGPYEGNSGLAGYLGTIYLSAWRGEQAALTLILAPLLIVAVWLIGLRLYRRGRTGVGPTAA
jgi:hypothetical protein